MSLEISPDLKSRFPGLIVLTARVKGVKIQRKNNELERFKEQLMREIRGKYDAESLKDLSIFRAYRDFFWSINIDPTKIRPASEALIRRILRGRSIPRINSLVDAYNLASIKTGIALAAFDEDRLRGKLIMRRAKKGERFQGIGMSEAMELKGGEVVISDEERLVAIYPYRDAEHSKVTEKTRNVLLLICGVPGISEATLTDAGRVAIDLITRFCGGRGFLEK